MAGVSFGAVTSTLIAGSTRRSVEVSGAMGAIVSGLLVSAVGASDSGSLADYKSIKPLQLTPAVRLQPVRSQPGAASSALYSVTNLEVR